MDELTIADKKYLSSKKAAQITGYAKDYVGQLCREGRVDARLVGRNWYVLDSSILEHRFGPAEGSVPVQDEKITFDATWKSPSYESEEVKVVPELVSKPYVPTPAPIIEPVKPEENKKVLSDMQSAWQEWFSTQEKQEKMLPDADEMMLPEGDGGTTESPEAEISVNRTQDTFVEEQISVPVEQIHISRIQEPEIERPVKKSYYDMPEPVRVSRQENPYKDETQQVPRFIPTEPVQRRDKASRSTRSGNKKGGTAVLQAIFISVAGLALAIAVLGSGLLENYSQNKEAAGNPVTNFFGGVSSIKSNK